MRRVGAAVAIGVASLQTAHADCVASGPTTVNCTGTTVNYQPGSITGITINIQSGASVVGGPGGTEAIFTTSSVGSTVNNFGTINGPVSFGGAFNTFTNAGLMEITDPAALLLGHSITGNFFQTSNGTLSLRFDANSFFDQLFIFGGNATLAGRLILVPQAGIYTAPVVDNFVATVFGTVSGQFNRVTSPSPFFSVSTDYSVSNLVTVTLTPIAFNAAPGLTPNQKAVADALTANFSGSVSGDAATLYGNLFAASSVSVFDQLSGAGTSATQRAAFGTNNAFMGLLGAGIPFGGGGGNDAPLGYASADKLTHPTLGIIKTKAQNDDAWRWQAWTGGFGATRSINSDAAAGSAASSQRGGGGAAGLVYRGDPDFTAGAAVGVSQSHFSVSDLATSGNLTAGHFGLHAAKRWGAIYAAAALAYARIDNDTTRTIIGVGPTETAKGRFVSDLLAGRLEIGWRHALGRYALTPFAAVQYSELWQRGYSESSTTASSAPGVLGLTYAAQAIASLPITLGAQIDGTFVLADGNELAPYARLAWLHEFKPDSRVDASFISIPGASFTVAGARVASDAARIDSGLRLTLSRRTALNASFTSELSDRSRSYAGTAALHVSW